jgi:hypothetical protein
MTAGANFSSSWSRLADLISLCKSRSAVAQSQCGRGHENPNEQNDNNYKPIDYSEGDEKEAIK